MHASDACDMDMKQQSPLHDTADSTAERTDKVAPRAAKIPPNGTKMDDKNWEVGKAATFRNMPMDRLAVSKYSAAIEGGPLNKWKTLQTGGHVFEKGGRGGSRSSRAAGCFVKDIKGRPGNSPLCSDWKNAMMG